MRLADLTHLPFAAFEERLWTLYPFVKTNVHRYAEAYQQIQSLGPLPADFRIAIEAVTDDVFDGGEYVDVYGIDVSPEAIHDAWLHEVAMYGLDLGKIPADSMHYALEATPWSFWLGADFTQETVDDFTPEDILAHCLAEMTYLDFYGYVNPVPSAPTEPKQPKRKKKAE